MPELPELVAYRDALNARIADQYLLQARTFHPFLLRTADPPLEDVEGKRLRGVELIGKRLAFRFDEELYMLLHLMVAGRLRWREVAEAELEAAVADGGSPGAGTGARPAAKVPGSRGRHKNLLARFSFSRGPLIPGDLTLTEAGSKRRAALHVVEGRDRALSFHKGGIDPLESRFDRFGEALMRENHTLKRALTDPRIVSGIGNSYSDEILHAAKLSPFKQTQSLSSDELERLHNACRDTLTRWITQLRSDYGDAFPEKVTAFKPAMAVHGKYNEPCPTCGAPVQRIRYAENECNYCPECQAGGTVFADRALSRLLKNDWPKSVAELEERGLA